MTSCLVYPQCNLEIKTQNTKQSIALGRQYIETLTNKYPKIKLKPMNNKNISELTINDKVIVNCKDERCSNTFEIPIKWIDNESIYCKCCKAVKIIEKLDYEFPKLARYIKRYYK